jgi:hypothetical protein
MDRQITCITINKEPTDCTALEYVGLIDSDILMPISEVVKRIEKSKDRFYVLDYDETQAKHYVHVTERDGQKYIRTKDYDTATDRLLNIGYCDVTNIPGYESGSALGLAIIDILRNRK